MVDDVSVKGANKSTKNSIKKPSHIDKKLFLDILQRSRITL
jgi:hypothetical protein